MEKKYLGIISATENRDDLRRLAAHRSIGAIPLGGKYRVIDFVLSNMVNAGITTIAVLAESDSRSLRDHVGTGRAWDLNRRHGGIFVFSDTAKERLTYDIKMLKDNIEYLMKSKEENVVISSTHLISSFDLKKAMDKHESSGADITAVYKKVNTADSEYLDLGVFDFNGDGTIEGVHRNQGKDKKANISMEMFILSKKLLLDLIEKCSYINYSRNSTSIIYEQIGKLNIKGYEYTGYLGVVNSLLSYFKTNMDMLSVETTKELFFDEENPVYSKSKDSSPTEYYETSKVSNALIANGCKIKGEVKKSIISRSVVIEEGAYIENSIILQNCTIKSGVKLKNVILDKNVTLSEGTELKGSELYPLVIEKELTRYEK